MRPEMVGGDEIEIVDAASSQCESLFEQFFWGHNPALMPVRNLVVLAEEATAGASGEEDGARALVPGEAGFFAEVRPCGSDPAVGRFAATAELASSAVAAALARAEAARAIVGKGMLHKTKEQLKKKFLKAGGGAVLWSYL